MGHFVAGDFGDLRQSTTTWFQAIRSWGMPSEAGCFTDTLLICSQANPPAPLQGSVTPPFSSLVSTFSFC